MGMMGVMGMVDVQEEDKEEMGMIHTVWIPY